MPTRCVTADRSNSLNWTTWYAILLILNALKLSCHFHDNSFNFLPIFSCQSSQFSFANNITEHISWQVEALLVPCNANISLSCLNYVTFLTSRTSTGSKVDVFHQSQPLTQSSDVTHAVRVVKNVTCLSSLLNWKPSYFHIQNAKPTDNLRKWN